MGNRNSHNFTTSSSTSFSDLPYKLGTTSYARQKGSRPLSSASTLPRPTKEQPLSQQRSTSLASLNGKRDNAPIKVVDKPLTVKRASTLSLPRQQSTTSSGQLERQSRDVQPVAPRQYNDNFLQSDVKKLFKVNDKRKSQAILTEDSKVESIDEKLAILKKQRSGEDEPDNTKTKKSKKTKKAPSLPPAETTAKSPVSNAAQSASSTNGNVRAKPLRKKSAAPAPPTSAKTSLDSAPAPPGLAPKPNDNNNNNNNNKTTVVEEELKMETSESETFESTTLKSDTKDSKVDDTLCTLAKADSLQVYPQAESTELVTETNPGVDNTSTSTVSALAPIGPEASNAKLPVLPKPKTVIERELIGTTKFTSSKKPTKAPPAPQVPEVRSQAVGTTNDTGVQHNMNATDEEAFIEAITKQALEDEKNKESREVAIQHNSQVDIAMESDDSLLEEENCVEKAGGVLKIFINKNAKKDIAREADEKSPDEETIPAESRISHSTEEKPSITKDSQYSIDQSKASADKDVSHSACLNDEMEEQPGKKDTTSISIEPQAGETLSTSIKVESDGSAELEGQDNTSLVEKTVEPSVNVVNQSSTGDDKDNDSSLRVMPDSEKTDPSCTSPQNPPNENDKSLEAEASPVTFRAQPITLGMTNSHPTGLHVTELEKKDDIDGVVLASTSSTEKTDPQQPEPIDLERDATLVNQTTPPLQNIFPVSDFKQPASPGATQYLTSGIFVEDSTGENKEGKKHKSKYSGIFRITKTMRRFMSSVGKSSKSPKVEETLPPEDEIPFAADNWTLAGAGKKPTPRKEYKPTWTESTFEDQASHASTSDKQHETGSNQITTIASDIQHTGNPQSANAASADHAMMPEQSSTSDTTTSSDMVLSDKTESSEEMLEPKETALPEETALREETRQTEKTEQPEHTKHPENIALLEENSPLAEALMPKETLKTVEVVQLEENLPPIHAVQPEETLRSEEILPLTEAAKPKETMKPEEALRLEETSPPVHTEQLKNTFLPEEILPLAEVIKPKDTMKPEEAAQLKKAPLPEETAAPDETVLPEKITLSDKTVLLTETAKPENAVQHKDTVQPEEIKMTTDIVAITKSRTSDTGELPESKDNCKIEEEKQKNQVISSFNTSDSLAACVMSSQQLTNVAEVQASAATVETNQSLKETNVVKGDNTKPVLETNTVNAEKSAILVSAAHELHTKQVTNSATGEGVTLRHKPTSSWANRENPAMSVPDVNNAEGHTESVTNGLPGSNSSYEIKRRSSALALMTPKAYGSSSSVYRPVSKLLSTPSPR